MIMRFLLLFLLLIFASCSAQEITVDEEPKVDSTVIVAFGDSLTEGLGVNKSDAYPAVLERELISLGYDVKVYNAGVSGETTSAAVRRLDWTMRLDPSIVIITTGANDAMRGIDLNVTRSNIEEIVSFFISNNVTVVLSGMQIYENLGSDYVNSFEQMYVDIALDYNVTFIPFFLDGVAGNSSLNQADEIHPNAAGYEIVVSRNVLPVVLELVQK